MSSDKPEFKQELKDKLSTEEFEVLRMCGTERPFSGKYNSFYEPGIYHCAACVAELFDSKTKFDSGSGWPSFYDVLKTSNVKMIEDNEHGMKRIEIRCNECNSHLMMVLHQQVYVIA